MIVQICVGSSCYIKGSQDIIELFTSYLEKNKLTDEVALAGSFCTGKCNRVGVTVQIDDDIYTGITVENFKEFFNDKVLKVIEEERKL